MSTKKYSIEQFNNLMGNIYPIIKVDISDQEQFPDEFSINFNKEDEPIHIRLVGDLMLFFGIDRGENYELLLRNNFDFSIEDLTLYKIAFENLNSFLEGKIQIVDTKIGCKMLVCGYDFEAAAIQMSWLKKELLKMYGEKLVIGIVSKDVVLMAKQSEKDIINNMKKEIFEIHRDGEKLLSKKLFLLDDENFTVCNA